jgi:hypothetical protein
MLAEEYGFIEEFNRLGIGGKGFDRSRVFEEQTTGFATMLNKQISE